MTPHCMDEWELAHWREQAEFLRRSWSASHIIDPCQDCTVAFSAEMRLVGLCNGVPGVQIGRPMLTEMESRRASNRLAARRWRARNPGRKHRPVAEPRTGTLG